MYLKKSFSMDVNNTIDYFMKFYREKKEDIKLYTVLLSVLQGYLEEDESVFIMNDLNSKKRKIVEKIEQKYISELIIDFYKCFDRAKDLRFRYTQNSYFREGGDTLLWDFLNDEQILKELRNYHNNKITDYFNHRISGIAKSKSRFNKEQLNREIDSKYYKNILNKESTQQNNLVQKPLIITEGKTDWKHLKKALERFQSEEFNLYVDLDIEFKEYEDVSMSDSELDDYAQSHAKEKNLRKIICIFDRDLSSRVEAYGKHDFIQVGNKQYINTLKNKCQKRYGKTSLKYLELEQKLDASQFKEIDLEIRKILTGDEQEEWKTLLHNNVYAFCIPKLNDELDEICIEFYYKDKDLKKEDDEGKRLFIADEFKFQENGKNCNRFISNCGKYKTDTQSGNSNNKKITLQYPNKKERGYVYKIDEKECNKSNTMNLLKNKFVENIYYEVEGFDNFDIENFKLIFDVIEKIVMIKEKVCIHLK